MEIVIGAVFGFLAWAVLRLILMGVYTVDQNERAVKIRLGRAVRVPGGKTTLDDPMAEALREDASALLAQPGAWTWLAEDGGEPVAMLYAAPPSAAGWIAPLAGVSPVAYLELMYVQPDDRGQGAGPALVGQLHRAADAAGVAVTLLHYEQVNPLSGPFWSRQGYRPLWTSWEARPARALR